MKSKPYIFSGFAAGIILAVVAAGCSKEAENAAAPAVVATNVTLTAAQQQRIQVQAVASTNFNGVIDTSGTVVFDADLSTTVMAPISGPASKILVQLGAKVKAGDPLALIDSPDFAAAVSAYRKAVATAKNLRRIADLNEELFQHGAVAKRDLEQAQTDAINADADRDAALSQLHSLGVNDEMLTEMQNHLISTNLPGVIRSPIDGTVVEKLINPGLLLQAGTTPCFTVADLSTVWIMPNIFDADLPAVAVGDPADIITGTGQTLPGTVDNISAIVDPTTRSIAVRIMAKNPNDVLKRQMYVRVLIHSARQSSGILVPVPAVLRDTEDLPFVYLADTNGGYFRRQVTLGSRVGNQYEIASGLTQGDKVVVDGGLFVQFVQNQ